MMTSTKLRDELNLKEFGQVSWIIVSAMGTVVAGLGTVALLIYGASVLVGIR